MNNLFRNIFENKIQQQQQQQQLTLNRYINSIGWSRVACTAASYYRIPIYRICCYASTANIAVNRRAECTQTVSVEEQGIGVYSPVTSSRCPCDTNSTRTSGRAERRQGD